MLNNEKLRSIVYLPCMAFSAHDELQPDLPEKLLRFITQQQEQTIQLQGQVEAPEAEWFVLAAE
ncbi:hypothetical protein [Endozoicomonas lisbonensis]|uniref:Uncharacterized protein n=1 Tax=Endozoicomonas lisbonensis TaxID=3120522 RepID=A0ABV2SNS8_9GAMM